MHYYRKYRTNQRRRNAFSVIKWHKARKTPQHLLSKTQDSRSTTWTGTSRACIVGMLLSAHAVRGVRDAAILSLATTTAENHRDLATSEHFHRYIRTLWKLEGTSMNPTSSITSRTCLEFYQFRPNAVNWVSHAKLAWLRNMQACPVSWCG